MERNGYSYEAENDGTAEEARVLHWARHIETGMLKSIDHTSHEGMSQEAFFAHIDLCLPPRPYPGVVPWNTKSIIKALHDHENGPRLERAVKENANGQVS